MDVEDEKVLLAKGKAITEAALAQIPFKKWGEISVEGGEDIESELADVFESVEEQEDLVRMMYDQKISRLTKGDELPPGVIKMVKVYVAIKRKLQVGDKMAGRHGNKGVVSRILPEEDLPYLPDGRPVDVVLNPLGVPSRMNIGQILETHLGWAARLLGLKLKDALEVGSDTAGLRKLAKFVFGEKDVSELIDNLSDEELLRFVSDNEEGIRLASPVFDGATEDEIRDLLRRAGVEEYLLPDGKVKNLFQTELYDGRNGEKFNEAVTVGVMYVLKLHHLVDDKIHARSIGPYSLVTQQPLGGKAQFGGQRLGEMEVWAMQAYGAAYALQEFLTVKSDDVVGRTRMYESIVRGEGKLEPGLPESFNVLLKELKALALDVELLDKDGTAIP
jgi:DNA-directed RNA polymerase subunit beta